ncbi:hypothetical protein M3231_10740 [Neobacillus mesonae]|nr:hypothetical protein [Neobacillus mesonae]
MNKLIWMKTNRVKNGLFVSIVLFLILAVTCPDEEDYYAWLDEQHGISCGEYNYIDGQSCVKDGQVVLRSGHTLNGMIFTKREMEYESLEDGTLYKVDSVGFFNTFY